MTTRSNQTAFWRPGLPGIPGSDLPSGESGRRPTSQGDTDADNVGYATVSVVSYPDYRSAQHTVDFLSDNDFPVERTAIVGTDLTLVESVRGRMTTGRSALAGAATGAWFGLFIGLLFGIFTVDNWLAVIAVAVFIGTIWGAVFGAIAHAMTGGRRDFTSASTLRASRYAVTVESGYAEQARQLIGRLDGRHRSTATAH